MARKRLADPNPEAEPDGTVSVVLRDGPLDGAHDALPEGSQVYANELHIPAPKCVAIYVRADEPGLDVPAYRFVRSEPVYR